MPNSTTIFHLARVSMLALCSALAPGCRGNDSGDTGGDDPWPNSPDDIDDDAPSDEEDEPDDDGQSGEIPADEDDDDGDRPPPPPSSDCIFYFENDIDYAPEVSIYFLYVSPSSSPTWGADQLGASIIPSGSVFSLTQLPPDEYDARVEDEYGVTYSRYGIDCDGSDWYWTIDTSDAD